jgi:predicted porin
MKNVRARSEKFPSEGGEMSLNRKAMVLAVGAALAAPSAYSQTSDKWEIYGKFYPELTHQGSQGTTAAGSSVSDLSIPATGTNGITNRSEMQISNTYLGFRGSKDVGRGMKAIGQLEQQVAIDEGGGTIGNRDSFAGLAADWGTVRLGNMDTPFKKYGDVLGFLGVSSGNFVTANNITRKIGFGTSSASSFNLRRANAIDFASPTLPGGVQVGVQYSIGNPTEAGINPGGNRFPRVVSMGVKWEQGPLYLAAAGELHNDLFGGSNNVAGSAATSNTGNAAANSKDRAVQLTAVYKIGIHSIEADVNTKQYKETGGAAATSFAEYKNNAYALIWEARWTNQWRTAVSYTKATAGSCSLVTNPCSTSGLDGNQITAGVTYSLDPSTYLFGLAARLTNGDSARFNNTSLQTPNPGEDITQIAVGLAYSF